MPRYTLYFDGVRSADATAADALRMERAGDLKVVGQQPGLLLISASEKAVADTIPKFAGWIASKEQSATHPKPKRPTVKTSRSK